MDFQIEPYKTKEVLFIIFKKKKKNFKKAPAYDVVMALILRNLLPKGINVHACLHLSYFSHKWMVPIVSYIYTKTRQISVKLYYIENADAVRTK